MALLEQITHRYHHPQYTIDAPANEDCIAKVLSQLDQYLFTHTMQEKYRERSDRNPRKVQGSASFFTQQDTLPVGLSYQYIGNNKDSLGWYKAEFFNISVEIRAAKGAEIQPILDVITSEGFVAK